MYELKLLDSVRYASAFLLCPSGIQRPNLMPYFSCVAPVGAGFDADWRIHPINEHLNLPLQPLPISVLINSSTASPAS